MQSGRTLWALQRAVDFRAVSDREPDDGNSAELRGSSADTPRPQSSADLLARVGSTKAPDVPDSPVGEPSQGSGAAGRAVDNLRTRLRQRSGPSGGGRKAFAGSRTPGGGRRASGTVTRSAASIGRGSFRVRRVRRLLRHIEPWSVLKITLVFYFCIWGLVAISTRMLWSAAEDAGTIAKVEHFVEELFTLETFEFDSGQIMRVFTLGGLVLVIGGTGLTVLLVVLFNLISDLMGGVRFTMIEEETAVRQRRLRHGDEEVDETGSAGRDSGRV